MGAPVGWPVRTRAAEIDFDDLGVAVTPLSLDQADAVVGCQIDGGFGLAVRARAGRDLEQPRRAKPQTAAQSTPQSM